MQVAGIPVRIRPAFFFVAALMGASRTTGPGLASWIAASFVSVLFHEFGHAAAGRAFGLAPSIELYERGGLTSFGPTGRRLPAWKDIVVCLAGPGAGFLLGGAVWAVTRAVPPPGLWALFVRDMLFCNLGWGVANLLPILPLDGGQVAATLLRNELRARILSLVAAAAAGAWALLSGWAFGALYAAWFAAPNVSALQRMARERREKREKKGPPA
jgi:stage IV sporulation protein FB